MAGVWRSSRREKNREKTEKPSGPGRVQTAFFLCDGVRKENNDGLRTECFGISRRSPAVEPCGLASSRSARLCEICIIRRKENVKQCDKNITHSYKNVLQYPVVFSESVKTEKN